MEAKRIQECRSRFCFSLFQNSCVE
ncbi:hypothetical protein ACFX12_033381 [Malus domestica]